MTYFRFALKSVASIVLIGLLALPGLSRFWTFVDFKINQDYIAEVLCINRNEPITMCYGQCYLVDQLEYQQTPDDFPIPSKEKEARDLIYLGLFSDQRFSEIQINPKNTFLTLAPSCLAGHLGQLFRPPQVA
ncbi:hypothetical protein KFE98_20365 [bacterium SCSIO 12741]|nr:hypothetical protein KFE98_20365 [bacterium SCSIO 12741]